MSPVLNCRQVEDSFANPPKALAPSAWRLVGVVEVDADEDDDGDLPHDVRARQRGGVGLHLLAQLAPPPVAGLLVVGGAQPA